MNICYDGKHRLLKRAEITDITAFSNAISDRTLTSVFFPAQSHLGSPQCLSSSFSHSHCFCFQFPTSFLLSVLISSFNQAFIALKDILDDSISTVVLKAAKCSSTSLLPASSLLWLCLTNLVKNDFFFAGSVSLLVYMCHCHTDSVQQTASSFVSQYN